MDEKHCYEIADAAEIPSPALLYYKSWIEENLRTMIGQAGSVERLWLHCKSHKMIDLIRLERTFGIEKGKCATIAEAEMLAMAEVSDILLAYPLVGPAIGRFLALVDRYPQCTFWAIGDDIAAITELGRQAVVRGHSIPFLIDVDMGMHRTGVPLSKLESFAHACWTLPGIAFQGLHCYDGNHHETDVNERMTGVAETDRIVQKIVEHLERENIPCPTQVMGGSPSFPCHAVLTDWFLSPGTIVINDGGYARAFPDLPYIPAAAILCRVVSHPAPRLFTLDLGYKGIASDPPGSRGDIVNLEHVHSLLQNEEHWVWEMDEGFENFRPAIGTICYVVPTHICPTSALYSEALIVENGRVVDTWEVTARNRRISV